MKVGDLVKQKYDLYEDGPAIIIDTKPAVTLANGHHCNALYRIVHANGKTDWAISLALELINESR